MAGPGRLRGASSCPTGCARSRSRAPGDLRFRTGLAVFSSPGSPAPGPGRHGLRNSRIAAGRGRAPQPTSPAHRHRRPRAEPPGEPFPEQSPGQSLDPPHRRTAHPHGGLLPHFPGGLRLGHLADGPHRRRHGRAHGRGSQRPAHGVGGRPAGRWPAGRHRRRGHFRAADRPAVWGGGRLGRKRVHDPGGLHERPVAAFPWSRWPGHHSPPWRLRLCGAGHPECPHHSRQARTPLDHPHHPVDDLFCAPSGLPLPNRFCSAGRAVGPGRPVQPPRAVPLCHLCGRVGRRSGHGLVAPSGPTQSGAYPIPARMAPLPDALTQAHPRSGGPTGQGLPRRRRTGDRTGVLGLVGTLQQRARWVRCARCRPRIGGGHPRS